MDISKYIYNEQTHYTQILRNLTLDYNNHADFSLKKIQNERRTFIESQKDPNKIDHFTRQKQMLYDLMWRLTHTTEEKFLKYLQQVKQQLLKLQIIKKEDKKLYPFFDKIYKLFLKSIQVDQGDQITLFSKSLLTTYEFLQEDNVNSEELFRLFTEIRSQRYALLISDFQHDHDDVKQYFFYLLNFIKQKITEYAKDLNLDDCYEPNIQDNLISTEQIDTLIIQEAEDKQTAPPPVASAQDYSPEDNNIESPIRPTGFENYFRQFFNRYKEIIVNDREYWTLYLFDILKELQSSKSDEEIRLYLIMNLQDNEAVEYLISFRKEIVTYSRKMQDVMEEKQELQQKYQSTRETFRPQNFSVKKNINQQQQQFEQQYQGDDEFSGQLNNHQILQLLGMSEDDVERESLLGLQKKQFQSSKRQQQKIAQNADEYQSLDPISLKKLYPTLVRAEEKEYIQFFIPPILKIEVDKSKLIKIQDLEQWAQKAFSGVGELNPLQTKCFASAMNNEENLLICAPTGAGKTNVALLTVLHELSKHVDKQLGIIPPQDLTTFKIVYISPMKALATEIVEKFSTKLSYLGITVKELTGDMQLTKQELAETQVIVSTPEKWDVITRKTDWNVNQLKLLIIDEIHLLNDDRGPVLECLVARTLRNIERQQTTMRLLGLSATLPNYKDVAAFLQVREQNIFHFDGAYRPVPLKQTFIGIKNPVQQLRMKNKRNKKDIYNDVCYELVKKHAKNNKQVMVFVHSRRETLTTAEFLIDKAQSYNELELFYDRKNQKDVQKKLSSSRNWPLKGIVPYGFGMHNAGMLRKDRNLVEKMFLDGQIRVLCTTATLAWGINLPAYAVIIKGAEIYNPSTQTQNLSTLDVQQIFGRAGRPQFDTEGDATLMADHTKIGYYMSALNEASNIESQLFRILTEALNAEIVLGNISNTFEAMEWMSYTFLNVRIKKSPISYGLKILREYERSYQIEEYISNKITEALDKLHGYRLIRFDKKTFFLEPTELGRIASHYYIKCETMQLFCKEVGIYFDDNNANIYEKVWTDLQLLTLLARSSEFENIKMRDDETHELKKIINQYWALSDRYKTYERQAGDKNISEEIVIDTQEKVLALISGYLCKYDYENFSLVIDTQYVIQNASRILRCLLDICLKKNLSMLAELTLKWCKLIENRMTYYELPLRQFCWENNSQSYNNFKNQHQKKFKDGFLNSQIVSNLEKKSIKMNYLQEINIDELANIIFASKDMAYQVRKYINYLPKLEVTWSFKPIASSILKCFLTITPKWNWSSNWHIYNEPFLILIDDELEILHSETIMIPKKAVMEKKSIETSFFLPFRNINNYDRPQYRIKVISDRWVDAEFEEYADLNEIVMSTEILEFTKLLPLQPLPIEALNNKAYESCYSYKFFNPVQTQAFHQLYHTDFNILVGAPTGSGKTQIAEIAIFRLFNTQPELKTVYIAPLKAIAKERIRDWKKKFEREGIDKKIIELTGDYTPDQESLKQADILVTTPEKWDGISRNWQHRSYVKNVGLMVFDEIHLLGQDRGPVLEVIVSRMNYIANKLKTKIRMVGLSTAVANGRDVANWFGTRKFSFYNFKPSVRPCPLQIYFEGFAEKHYCPRMGTMNKPVYNNIKKYSEGKPVLVFVSSRRQTRLTALDLIALVSVDSLQTCKFLQVSQQEIDGVLKQVKDTNLKQTLSFGIGMHHAGLQQEDRRIVEELFVSGKIQVLIATSTLAWGVNFPARLVIVKGTEFFDAKNKKYVDFPIVELLQMIGRAGRPQFDDKGIACVLVEQSKKNFYCKYLNDPFPIESSLLNQLPDHINAEVASGTITNKSSCLEYLSWTYFWRRLIKNPAFYGLKDTSANEVNDYLLKLIDNTLAKLAEHKCIIINEDNYNIEPTFLGHLASYYYIKHETVYKFWTDLPNCKTIFSLLKELSDAHEFDEIPVRHNEDILDSELAKLCRYTVSNNMDSPNTKTLLLFQAHFSRLPLPIRDYITDTKLVIDSSIRVIHSLVDMAAEQGDLHQTFQLIQIMQMIMQGVWYDDSGFRNISGITNEIIIKLAKEEHIEYLSQLIEFHKKGRLVQFLRRQDFQLEESQIEQMIKEVEQVPDMNMQCTISQFDSENLIKIENKKRETNYLIEGSEGIVTVNLKRMNDQHSLFVKIQRATKLKEAGWWIIIGLEKLNKLLAIKKINFSKTAKKNMQVQLPEKFFKTPFLNVYLFSDSYMGIDQFQEILLNAA